MGRITQISCRAQVFIATDLARESDDLTGTNNNPNMRYRLLELLVYMGRDM